MSDEHRPDSGDGQPPHPGPPQSGVPTGGQPAYGDPTGGTPESPWSRPAGPQPGGFRPPGGQPAYGPAGYGPPPQYGQPGQPQYGPPPQYGNPQYGPPGGPPQYGPPGYGQPQYGPPQYGPPGYGQPQYGQEGSGWGPEGQPDLLHQLPVTAPPHRSRARVLWATVATGTAVVLTAGGVYAYSALSGTSAVLPAKVPGDSVAYLEVNLDPPAAQKVALIRFLRKFPDAKTGGEDGSLLDSVVEPLIEDPGDRKVYVENIEPWLGKHIAVIGDPQDGKVQPVVVAETTDAAKTRAGLDAINRQEQDPKDKVYYAAEGSTVYLAQTQAAADRARTDSASGPLADSGTFSDDVDKVGEGGIVTFWADLGAAARLDPGDAQGEGRVAGSLTITESTADLAVRVFGNPAKAGTEVIGPRVGRLPQGTAFAVGVSGADELVRSGWEQAGKAGLGSQLSKVERDSGLRLPDDLVALVGSTTVFAAGDAGSGETGYGLVTSTQDKAGARRAADVLLGKLDEDTSLTARDTADGTVLASSEGYARRLAGQDPSGGSLADDGLFKAALPDIDSATAVVYVNVEQAEKITGEEVPKEASPVRAFGLTASTSGGQTTVHMRLVVR